MKIVDTDNLLDEILARLERVCERRNLGPANKEALMASVTALFLKKFKDE